MSPRPPGFVSPRDNPDVIMMICTAGHVDHGKTQLVKLLTGCNTDRLKVEQERGLTIELGFAPCLLGGDLSVGIVDVPGHEKFVRNMVAGVSGIELTIFVIAADDGIMPQTVEHLQIMELLGVRRGLVALTKTDLVSPERVKELTEAIREFLTGTFLEGCPICPVSSETFEGYPDFYDTLVGKIKAVAKRRRCGVFRMPVERVFTRPGFGAVFTGIPVDGAIAVGDEVEVVPGGQRGKVRGIQRFLRDVQRGEYGQCLAINVPEFSKRPPERGQVICRPGYLEPADGFHLAIQTVPKLDKPLRNAEEVKFHTGTVEASGKIYYFESKEVGGGQDALAMVVLQEPVAAATGDRCIIRRPSPATTVAGGEILAVADPKQRGRKPQIAAELKRRHALLATCDLTTDEGRDRLIEAMFGEKETGASLDDIAKATLIPPENAADSAKRLRAIKKLLLLSGGYYIHADAYAARFAEIESRFEAAKEKSMLSLTMSDLRKDFDWPAPLWSRVLDDIEKKGIARRADDKFILTAAVDGMSEADRVLMHRILDLYDKTGYESPRPDELPERLGAPAARIENLLQHLYNEKRLIRLAKNVVVTYDHLKRAQDRVLEIIEKEGTVNSGLFKHEIDSSRKYALAILDYLDSLHITVRVGNDRKLTRNHREHLLQ